MKGNFIKKSMIIIISFLCISTYSTDFFFVDGDKIRENTVYFYEKQEINSKDILLDMYISLIMKLIHFPSLSIIIIDNDDITWSKSYGFYDLEKLKTANENTIYLTASISKTITGTALLQLWEQGLFDLDEDVNNYLPFSLRNPNFPEKPITFRMLLSHTSSLNNNIPDRNEYYWFNFSDDPPFDFYPDPYLQELLLPGGKYYYEELWSEIYEPGESAIYANVGFDLISYLIELISHQSFVDYCKQYIFHPLKMYNTSFNLSELSLDRVAIPYNYHNGEYLQINELSYRLGNLTPSDKYWRMRPYAAGGLYTTVSDLSNFLIAHMNGGCFQEIRILNHDTVQLMHEVQKGKYGLAWQTISYKPFEIKYSGHKGGYLGALTYMYYIPNENIGIICFVNGDFYSQNDEFRFLGEDYLLTILSIKAGLKIIPKILR